MTAEQFIDALEKNLVLRDRMVAKLRKKVANSGGNMPAKALAKLLVEKNHLTEDLAAQLLNEPLGDDTYRLLPDDDESDEAPDDTLDYESDDEFVLAETELAEEVPLTPIEEPFDRTISKPSGGQRSEPPAVSERSEPLPIYVESDDEDTFTPTVRSQPTQENDKALGDRIKSRRKKKPVRRENEWDSPLLLIGGGSLILLVLCGITVWYLLFRQTGDEQLNLARTANKQGSYSQAVSLYEEFLERFPGHAEQSPARVELAMVRLRRATEGRSDYRMAMDVAESEISSVESEESFGEAHEELATLLPQIARGLAEQADAESDPTERGTLVSMATTALTYCSNSKYIPNSLRDDSELFEVRETLARVQRRQESYDQLHATISSMQQAIDAGDTRRAYEAHRQFVKTRPGYASDAGLMEMVAKTSAAELDGIRFVTEEQPAESDERPTVVVASLALARHRVGEPANASGVVCIHVDGALYGLDAETGRLRWRRFTGFDGQAFVKVTTGGVLVRDARHNDLQLRDTATGDLRWRQSFEEPFTPPLVLGSRGYVATESGRLHVIDVASGTRAGYLQFSQPLSTTPVVDPIEERLYLVGEHSSLYVISLKDLTCRDVYYLGHSVGSIQAAPAVVLDKLAVVVNEGVESSRLRLFSVSNPGEITGEIGQNRLDGLVVTPPLVEGRRITVLTDRGQVNCYEIGPQSDESALHLVATRPASTRRSVRRYALMHERSIWIADTQLAKYVVQPTDNRLLSQTIEDSYGGSVFDYPLQTVEQTLIHVRRPEKRQGAAVAAMHMPSGEVRWETDLGVPPVGSPLTDAQSQTIVSADSNGDIFVLDRNAIRSRVQDEPIVAINAPIDSPPLVHEVDLGDGRAVYSSSAGSPWVMLYQQEPARRSARWIELPSPLAAPPARLGQGFVVPLDIGQVFYLSSADGVPRATPFQPRVRARTRVAWTPIGASSELGARCVLADDQGRIYLLSLEVGPPPSLQVEQEAEIAGFPLASRIAVTRDRALSGTQNGKLAIFELPSLQLAKEVLLTGQVVWGPYAIGDQVLLATDADQLHCIAASGSQLWQLPLAHGELAGPPAASTGTALLAYRTGELQKLALASGEALGELKLDQPLASGPVLFQQRYVIAAHDGTLLVVDQP